MAAAWRISEAAAKSGGGMATWRGGNGENNGENGVNESERKASIALAAATYQACASRIARCASISSIGNVTSTYAQQHQHHRK